MNNLSANQQGFDSNALYLGVLCARGHDWNGTGRSLRYKSIDRCAACLGVANPGSRQIYKSAKDKFWERVDKRGDDECWTWRGRTDDKGYGQIDYQGKSFRAHRFSYILHFGEIPNGLHVLHKCDCPPCTNPSHLFLGTNADNVADKIAKNRQYISAGSKNGRATLTEADVRKIRNLYAAGFTCKQLVQRFNLPFSTCWNIVTRQTWKHVD